MSANSSDSPDHPPQNLLLSCHDVRIGNLLFAVFTVCTTLLLVPLSVTVLHLGHQRWRRSAKQNHSDIITYHMALLEILMVVGSIAYCLSIFRNWAKLRMVSSQVFYITGCGQMSMHVFICVERYLAVVHPVKYRSLRQSSGVTIRNVAVGSVWLTGCVEMNFNLLDSVDVVILLYTVQLVLTLLSVSFCNLCVLRVLKRPGPGGGQTARVDPTKRCAFSTITAILATLLLRLGGSLVSTILYVLPLMSKSVRCLVLESSYWLGLPSSLVMPLLFLYRAGKLRCCRNTESGRGSA